MKDGVESDISKPFDTGQTGVSFLLRRPGNRNGRHVISTEPGRGCLSGVELQQSTIKKEVGFMLAQENLKRLKKKDELLLTLNPSSFNWCAVARKLGRNEC